MAITITKPTIGGSNNTWGQLLNDSLDAITDGVNGTAGTLSPDLEEGAWKIGGTTISTTGAELNVLDGSTSATATTVVDADRVVFNDAGLMKQVSLSDIATYMQANGHADTSSQSSVNNSGTTYIQDITLDTYGHVTGITSATQSTSTNGPSAVSGDRFYSNNFFSVTTATLTLPNNGIAIGRSGGRCGNVRIYNSSGTQLSSADGIVRYQNTSGSSISVYAWSSREDGNGSGMAAVDLEIYS